MKQTVAVKKEGPAAASKKPAAQTPARALSAASNHTLIGQSLGGDWEHQADWAAERVLRGETGVGRLLRPAPAAGFRLAASRGLPLPADLRERFERGFGADLSAVRIHCDEPAMAAAKTERARAFTSGRDIYLSRDVSSLASESGRRLLAHEVAHALQQAGKDNGKSYLIVSEVGLGSGKIQRHDLEIEEVFKKAGVLQPPADILTAVRDVAENHKAAGDADDLCRAEADAIIQKLDAGASSEEIAAGLAVRVAAPDFPKESQATIRLCFDVFKALGYFTAAMELIDNDSKKVPQQTALLLASFYTQYLRGNEGRSVSKTLKTNPVASKYWTWAVMDSFLISFYGLLRVPQNLDPDGKFAENIQAELAKQIEAKPLAENECLAFALKAFWDFDDVRQAVLKNIVAPVDKSASLLDIAKRKFEVIAAFQDGGLLKAKAVEYMLSPEVVELCEIIDEKLEPMAEKAVEFWTEIVWLAVGLMPKEQPKDLEEILALQARRAEFAETVPMLEEIKGYETDLKAAAAIALALGKEGKLPTEAQLRANLAGAQKKIKTAVNKIDQNLIGLQRKLAKQETAASDKKAPQEEIEQWQKDAETIGLLMMMSFCMAEMLNTMDQEIPPVKDTSELTPLDKQKRQDLLLRFYLKVAQQFQYMGVLFGYGELVNQNNLVLFAETPGLKQSYVGLYGSFQSIPTTISEFNTLFPKGTIQGIEPITGADIAMFVTDQYYLSLCANLETVMDEKINGVRRGDLLDPGLKSVVDQAVEELPKKSELPKRYRMPKEDAILYVRPADYMKMSDLISANVVYQIFLKENQGEEEAFIIPQGIFEHKDGPLVWAIPDFHFLAFILSEIPGLAEAKLKNGKTVGKPAPGEWLTWLQSLKNLEGGTEAWSKIFSTTLKESMEGSWEILRGSLREASIIHRKSHGPSIAKGWQSYDSSDLMQFSLPNELIRKTLTLAGSLQPADEMRLQAAALFLEIIPDMHAKLATQPGMIIDTPGTDRMDIIIPLLPHLLGVCKVLEDPKNVKDIIDKMKLSFPLSEIYGRKGMVESLRDEFMEKHKSSQEYSQLKGDAQNQTILNPDLGTAIVAEEAEKEDEDAENLSSFTNEGVKYKLIRLYKSFTYIPELALPASAIDWPESKVGASKLFDADGQPIPAEARKDIPLLEIERNNQSITVMADNDKLLSELTYAVSMEAINRQLQALGEFIEIYEQVLITGVQIICPETAIPIAAGEISLAALEFINSSDFDDIKKLVSGDVEKLFGGLWAEFKENLNVSSLWNYLLFDDVPDALKFIEPLVGLLGNEGAVKKKTKNKDAHSAIGKVFTRLKKAITGVKTAMEVLHENINEPVRHTRMFVFDHPVMAVILRAIAQNLYMLESLSLKSLGDDIQGYSAQTILGKAGEFLGKIKDILDRLDEMELPKEIIPLDFLTEMIVNFIVDHLPAKYRLTFQGLRAAMDAVGFWKPFFDWLGKELKAKNLDPNIFWQQTIRTELEPHFEQAVQDITTEINGFFKKVPFLKSVEQLAAPSFALENDAEDFPEGSAEEETQLLAADSQAPNVTPPWSLTSAGSGQPLNPTLHTEANRRFGQDFSHVRLHSGENAQPYTSAFMAEGLTSGSHIFIRPGLNENSGPGKRTLFHELGHVLQQSGPRPMGRSWPAEPQWGRPHLGLVRNPGRESEADQMGKQALGNREGHAGQNINRSEGIQPDLTEVIGQFFTTLGDFRKIKEHAGTIEEMKKPGRKGWPKAAKDLAAPKAAEAFGERLVKCLKKEALPNAEFESPFDLGEIPTLIADHIGNKESLDFKVLIEKLVKKSLDRVKKKKSDAAATGDEKPAFTFEADDFLFELSDYLLSKTGVIIKMVPTPVKASEDKNTPLDLGDPFKSIKVSYLHLPLIGPTSKIWRTIIANTFPLITAEPELRKKQSAAWRVLLGEEVTPGIYEHKKVGGKPQLVLSDKIVKKIEIELAPATALTADALPPWSDYINTNRVEPKTGHEKLGQIGLRLGAYQDRNTVGGIQNGQDRDSHHLVQYLLIEYFSNTKTGCQPFPYKLSLYPGVQGKDPVVDQIGVVDEQGKPKGDALGKTTSFSSQIGEGRGPVMPAILISKHAHQRGGVHISPKSDDAKGDAPSQGGAVHTEFKKQLGKYEKIVFSEENLKAVQKQKPLKGSEEITTPADLSDGIYKAVCATYKEVKKQMQTKLNRALDNEEKEYYTSIVRMSTDKGIYNPDTNEILDLKYKPGSVDSVKTKAADHARDVMAEQFGFPNEE